MGDKIPMTKMVTKNGKSFAQTFWVAPENASTAAVNRALGVLPALVPVDEYSPESPAAALALKNAPGSAYNNPEDFLNGFQSSHEWGNRDHKEALTSYLLDNDPDEVHSVAYMTGFREGIVAKLAENPDNHVRGYVDIVANTDAQWSQEISKHQNDVLTHNPFKKGDTVVVPAGTPFTSTDPSIDGVQHTKVSKSYKVHGAHQGYADAKADSIYIRPATVNSTGAGGYWKDFVVTPELVSGNGHELLGQSLGDSAESRLRGSIY